MFRYMSQLALVVALAASASAAEELKLKERWIYFPTNFAVKENVDKLETLFERAGQSGYTHAFITDSKFGHLQELPVPETYFKNVERTKQLAAKNKLEIVPGVFPIGWSNDILWNDPNMAEGLPVRDALFVVKGGEAQLVADPPIKLRGGDFSDLKQWEWHDPTAVADNGAVRMSDLKGGVSRVVQSLQVSPFRQYHVSARIKTENFRGTPEIKILAGGDQQLNYNDLGIQPTQDWTTHHTVFNSLDNSKVGLYLGCWGSAGGSLWYDDVTVEEVGLVNVLRRPGAPLVIKREGETKPLTEGTDFEPVADPKMGNVPWRGNYDVYHEPPAIRTKLADGTRLRVSFYHPMIIYGGSVMIALSEPKTMEMLRDQAERVHKLWNAHGYVMQHDEIRIMNWDQASMDRKLDAGQILADNIKQCTKILQKVNPAGNIYVWSDMFDPFHNAHDKYYLVRGNLANSWDGLDPKVIILNWNGGKAAESLKFFADRGHRTIIAGYYDAPVDQLDGWLKATREAGGVDGVMYTTWQNNFSDLEAFAKQGKFKPAGK